MKGILKAFSIQTYGIFDGKKCIKRFTISDSKIREKIDPLQGKIVDYLKDIVSLFPKKK